MYGRSFGPKFAAEFEFLRSANLVHKMECEIRTVHAKPILLHYVRA